MAVKVGPKIDTSPGPLVGPPWIGTLEGLTSYLHGHRLSKEGRGEGGRAREGVPLVRFSRITLIQEERRREGREGGRERKEKKNNRKHLK